MPDAVNNSLHAASKRGPRRRSVLDLAPLELACMNTLWPLGEATVRDIRDRLAERRPRAYTTIMTIMDRLARKGIVERRKSGRAYVYRAHLTASDARSQALAQLVDNFFAGSVDALLAQLGKTQLSEPKPDPAPRAFAAAASTGSALSNPTAAHIDDSAAKPPNDPSH
jgi:BlaI family transcriptional regulator, penicillinase repressor